MVFMHGQFLRANLALVRCLANYNCIGSTSTSLLSIVLLPCQAPLASLTLAGSLQTLVSLLPSLHTCVPGLFTGRHCCMQELLSIAMLLQDHCIDGRYRQTMVNMSQYYGERSFAMDSPYFSLFHDRFTTT